jgi:hypothetical protein
MSLKEKLKGVVVVHMNASNKVAGRFEGKAVNEIVKAKLA